MTSDSSELRIPDHSTDENLTMRRLPALLLLLIATLPALAQVQWRSGALLYTPAYDFTLGYTPNGTGYFVSQAYIPSPPQPFPDYADDSYAHHRNLGTPRATRSRDPPDDNARPTNRQALHG